MKSLKRTLSLVLVLVMVLGMFGIASATSFKDDDTIQYKEAVDVMSGIGAISGYTDGSFGPKNSVTRAEAAKMVTYAILGKSAAEKLPNSASSFKDVDANFAWAIPSIEYLVSRGVLNGRGDGTFDPGGSVTAYEIGKMMLCAVGYGANDEYVGSGWALNVAIDANRLKLFAGRAADANDLGAAASREECALYTFNGLTRIYQVKWSEFYGSYFETTDPNNRDKYTLAKEIYPTLVGTYPTDAYGRPAVMWKYGVPSKTICFLVDEPVLTYTTGVKLGVAGVTLSNMGFQFANVQTMIVGEASTDYATNYWVNGKLSDTFTAAEIAAAIASNVEQGGNGIRVEFFSDYLGNITDIVVTTTYFAKAIIGSKDNAATTNVDERSIKLTEVYPGHLGGHTITAYPAKSASGLPAATGFDEAFAAVTALTAAGKEAFLLVQPNYDATTTTYALKVMVPETKTLTASKYTADNFVAGGTTYSYSKLGVSRLADYNFNEFTAILDEYGYVMAVDFTAKETYAYVIRSGVDKDFWGGVTYYAELLYTDGTKATVKTDKSYAAASGDVDEADEGGNLAGKIVQYSTVAGGRIKLVDKTNKTLVAGAGTGALNIKTGVSAFTFGAETLYATNKTIYMVKTGSATNPIYTVYTGMSAVPGYQNAAGAETGANGVAFVDGYANIVFLDHPTLSTASGSQIVVFGLYNKNTARADDGSIVTYYQALAFVNGVPTQLNLDADGVEYPAGVYSGMATTKVNSELTVTTLSGKDQTTIFKGVSAPSTPTGLITFTALNNSTTSLAYASNCVVFQFDDKGNVTPVDGGVLGIEADALVFGAYTFDKAGQVNGIFYWPDVPAAFFA